MKKTIGLLLAVLMIISMAVSAAAGEAEPAAEAGTAQYRDAGAVTDPVHGWGAYDALIEAAKVTADPAEKAELMHEAEDMLMAVYTVIPLYYYTDTYLVKNGVEGIYSDCHDYKYLMYAKTADGADTLYAMLGNYIESLDPFYVTSLEEFSLMNNMFSGLFTYNEAGELVPACAESCTVSDDGHTYTVTLKEGLKWSDGTDLTASDFVFAWWRDVEYFADYCYLFASVNGDIDGEITDLNVQAIDDRTLQFQVEIPGAYVEDLLTYPVFYPVPENYIRQWANAGDADAWSRQIGFPVNGAYMFTGLDDYGNLILEKNPYWYDADKVQTEKIVVLLCYDIIQAEEAFMNGTVDFMYTVTEDTSKAMTEAGDPALRNELSMGLFYMVFNSTADIFSGKTPEQAAAMREAVSLLIDRDKLCRQYIGGGVPANSIISPAISDGNGGIFEETGYFDPYAINNDREGTIAKARELMESAGFAFDENGMLSAETPLNIYFLLQDSMEFLGDAVAEDLGVIGIVLTPVLVDWSTFFDAREAGNYTLVRSGWINDSNSPMELLETMTTYYYSNLCVFGAQ